MGNSHEAPASLACRPGLLQNTFHLHHRFKHHRVIFHVDLAILSVERHALVHILTPAAVDTTASCDSLIKLSSPAPARLFLSFIVHHSQPIHLHPLLTPYLLSTSPPPLHHLPLALLFLLFCLLSFSPGDRVQVIDDSNEEWWKVGNKSFASICMSCILVFLMCLCARARVCVFKLSYYCVTPAPYLHFINMQAALDRNRT